MKIIASLFMATAMITLTGQSIARDLSIQSRYPALQFKDATPGGAHPVGGAAMNFVNEANKLLAPHDLQLKFHVSGSVNSFDKGSAHPPVVKRKEWGSLIKAVAAGPEKGGLVASMGIPANSGLAFGEFFSAGVPFSLTAAEWLGFVYGGGGLALHQQFYDEAFDNKVKVIPIGLGPSQTAGFFPEPIPWPTKDKTTEQAMAELCAKPWIVRYPLGAQVIFAEACQSVGGGIDQIGKKTRCEDAKAQCGKDAPGNKIITEPTRLTFGGFAPGVIPQTMYANGNIDAFELNMPSDHVQLLKLAAGKQGESNATVDFSAVAPPYHYLTSWQGPILYVELVFNKAEWQKLSEAERLMIETAARASMLTTYSQRLAVQGDALEVLTRNGVTNLQWPRAVMSLMKSHADVALDRLAADSEAKGDDTLARGLAAVRAYRQKNAAYFDADDVSQGVSSLPEHP